MNPHLRRLVILFAVLWLQSGWSARAEAAVILETPAGLNPGDQFRFVFITDGIRDSASTNIADYDNFVRAQAGGATYGDAVVDWLAIASTDSVDAIQHIGEASTRVYLSDGALVTGTTTTEGLWSGQLVRAIRLDLAGNPVETFAWTGTNFFGTGFGGPLGSLRPMVGSSIDFGRDWVASGRSPHGDLRPFYGISSILTVPQNHVPEPATLALLATALLGISIHRSRRRRNQQRVNIRAPFPRLSCVST